MIRSTIALSLLIALAACNDKGPRPFPVPTPPIPPVQTSSCGTAWTVNPLVNGVAFGPTSCSADGSFTFPVCPSPPARTDGMHTLVRPTGPLQPGATFTADFEIADAGKFVGAQEQEGAPYVSLFIQRTGDNWSGAGEFNEYRAYSINGAPPNLAPLSNGRYQLSAQLVRDQWTNVQEAGTEEGWRNLLANAERIGVVFGTYYSGKAHGICPDNDWSRFIMHSLTVQ